jgi:hypothetical protein
VPGAGVLLADGRVKPVEEGPRTVVATITSSGIKELVEITVDIDGADGDKTTTVVATAEHPFWVDDQGRWLNADALTPGNDLLTADGERVEVLSTERRTESHRVHNLTINGVHTYYVVTDTKPVLVHNSNCINWAANSVKTWGHTFSRHGEGAKNLKKLQDRARGTGKDQGQWLDNGAAAEFLRGVHNMDSKPFIVDIPEGLGQVIKPDGSIVTAQRALIVPGKNGLFKTAYPYLGAP